MSSPGSSPSPVPELSSPPARVQPLYGARRKESSATGLGSNPGSVYRHLP